MSKHRLIFGFGGGSIWACGCLKKTHRESYEKHFPRVLEQFDNDILVSSVGITYKFLSYLNDVMDCSDRLYLDSGGYTLYRDEQKLGKDNKIFHKRAEYMRKRLLKCLTIVKPKVVFELDNEYFRKSEDLLSPENYCRNEIKAITGFYPVPVFKVHQGFDYWKALCDSDMYPMLSIGGLAHIKAWHKYKHEFKIMMDYARSKNKKVHLLGCANTETFKLVQPDSVDYNIFQWAVNITTTFTENPEMVKAEFWEKAREVLLRALARAKVKTYFFDSYQITDNE